MKKINLKIKRIQTQTDENVFWDEKKMTFQLKKVNSEKKKMFSVIYKIRDRNEEFRPVKIYSGM